MALLTTPGKVYFEIRHYVYCNSQRPPSLAKKSTHTKTVSARRATMCEDSVCKKSYYVRRQCLRVCVCAWGVL